MSRSLASWKLLEDMMLELKKAGVIIPIRVVEDLRAAKSMLDLSCMKGGGDALQKAETLFVGVEAYLVDEGQKRFGEAKVENWLRQFEKANTEPLVAVAASNQFVVGIPKDQQWIRIEPLNTLTAERIVQLAESHGLQVKLQTDGKLIVYGPPVCLGVFLRAITAEKP